MEQRISVLTIGADNLPAMKEFYEQTFDWKPVAENKDIIFYKLNGFLFSICKRKEMAEFIGINPEGNGFRSVTFGYNVNTTEEVKELYIKLKSNGVKIIKEPTEPPFGGLFFYVEDIEGNIFEIAYNPFVTLDKDNNIVDHKPINHL
ncbi:MAG: VOC family protein [Prolixibacteraceae bacterium]|nr:VOC family protein [Prolixibacteraceae bacterium]